MSSTPSTMQRIFRGVHRRWVHTHNNYRIRSIARQVAKYSAKNRQSGDETQEQETFLDSPVIFFNASTRLSGLSLNAAFSLAASWGVQLSGVPVIHFVCQAGMSPCILGTDRDQPDRQPPCRECIAQSRANYAGTDARWFEYRPDPELGALLQNLSLDELISFEYNRVPLGQLVLPSVRWVLRCHHLEDSENNRYLYCQYILSAWRVAQEFDDLLEEIEPQAVVVFNGITYPEAMVRWVARKHGVRVVSHEVNMGAYSAFFTEQEATFRSMEVPEDFQLNDKQDEQLNAYLSERFSGDFKMAGIKFWPEIKKLDESFLSRAASFEQIVPVFTNVIFDTSQVHANSVFTDMFAWLDFLLEIIRAHPETYFIIRAHPDESRPGKASRESVEDWVKRNQVSLLPNVLFVGPDEYISSYELVQRSKFVLMYNSTIGLEATLLGVPAVCAGKAHYTQIHTVFFPQTIDAYQEQVNEFLAAQRRIEVPQEFVRNARRFLYYQLFLSSLSFEDFVEDDKVWRGYVVFKQKDILDKLIPENSRTIRTVVEGILQGKSFLLPHK